MILVLGLEMMRASKVIRYYTPIIESYASGASLPVVSIVAVGPTSGSNMVALQLSAEGLSGKPHTNPFN